MPKVTIEETIRVLAKQLEKLDAPAITLMHQNGDDPFRILIATILSLRTKDEITIEASNRLFSLANTPEKMLGLKKKKIAQSIYPVGFYNTKAKNILDVCRIITEKHKGKVPKTMKDLLELPGVGRKTANLVLAKGYNIPAICVDTHVHRILNRIGYIRTHSPEKTEMRLRKKVPKELWIPINDVFVAHGQAVCTPQSPWCSKCPLKNMCRKINVPKSR